MSSRASCGALFSLLLLAACAAAPAPAHAPTINTSRLGLAKAPGTVPRGVVQLEAGYSRAQQEARTRHTLGEAVVRIGLGPRSELRLGVPSYQRVVTGATTAEGAGDASVALKHRLRDANRVLPAVALTLGSTLPTASHNLGAGAAQPELGVSAEWMLVPRLRALVMGTHRDAVVARDRHGLNTLAAAGRLFVTPGAAAQLEYGRTTSTRAGSVPTTQLRAGAALRLTPKLQLDGWVGRATTAGKSNALIGIGFAQRW